MNKNNDTAKKQEGMGKGLLIIAGLLLLGAVGGYLAASFADGKDLDRIFKDLDGFTVGIVFTVLHILFSAVLLIVSYAKFSGIKKREAALDPDDEDGLDLIEKQLNSPLIMCSILQTAGIGLFGCAAYFLIPQKTFLALISPVVLIISMVLTLFLSGSIVDLEKKLNPEKKGSVWSNDFRKDWMGSCDEAQKAMVYKAGYKAFMTGNSACSLVFTFVLIGQFIFKFGVMPIIAVSVIWCSMMISYSVYGAKLENGENKDD